MLTVQSETSAVSHFVIRNHQVIYRTSQPSSSNAVQPLQNVTELLTPIEALMTGCNTSHGGWPGVAPD